MQGTYQNITWDLREIRYSYDNDGLSRPLQFPLDTLTVPVFYPGRYETEKGERSGTSLTTVSIVNENLEEQIRQKLLYLGPAIYGKRGGRSGSGKSSGITTQEIKGYLDALGVVYKESGLSKRQLLDLLLRRVPLGNMRV